MTGERAQAMVMRDAEGNYYVFPLDVVERARVPAERVADLEQAMGEVTGYSMRGAVGGGIVDLEANYLVEEDVDAWPVVELPRGAGFVSALKMVAGSRF